MPPMPAGHRDSQALSVAEQLTAAAEEMRKKSVHTETVREADLSEIERLRADTHAALSMLADEVANYKAVLLDIKSIVEDEARRRP